MSFLSFIYWTSRLFIFGIGVKSSRIAEGSGQGVPSLNTLIMVYTARL